MRYVDAFLIPVPLARKDAYRSLAARASVVLKESGALRVVECWLDATSDALAESYHAIEARESNSELHNRASTAFRHAADANEEEGVVLSWVEWPDKSTRDRGMKQAMEDPRMQFSNEEPVFDGSRLIASGFIPILVA